MELTVYVKTLTLEKSFHSVAEYISVFTLSIIDIVKTEMVPECRERVLTQLYLNWRDVCTVACNTSCVD